MDIVEKIKFLLKEKGYSLRFFAKKIDYSTTAIYNIFNGRTSMSVELLEKISKALDVHISYFYEKNTDVSKHLNASSSNKNNVLNDINDLEKIKMELFKLQAENEKLKMELDFYKHAVEMKDILICQMLELNKIKEDNSCHEKTKKSA